MPGMGEDNNSTNSENEALEENLIKNLPKSNREYVKTKMETMQKRIDELKEKVKNEGELLHSEASLKTDVSIEKFHDSLSTLISPEQSENGSDKSLYYSPSNYSLCSLTTSSSETAYNHFTKFVNNFVKNQNPRERLSLLQLHSKKQISLNMMRHSLSELDTRCSEELELIERNLQHLQKLAVEFDVNVPSDNQNDDFKLKALEFHSSDTGDSKKLHVRSNPVFIWPHEERKSRMNATYNPHFIEIAGKDKSSIRQ